MRKMGLVTVTLAMFVILATLTACEGGPQPTVSPLAGIEMGSPVLGVSAQTNGGEMDFGDVMVNGIPLVVLIVGIVQFIKQMGVSGKILQATSAGIGVVVGLAYQLSLGIPADFAGWFGAVLYGLGLGVVASGLVDQARNLAERAGR